jgi:hypothetical protein
MSIIVNDTNLQIIEYGEAEKSTETAVSMLGNTAWIKSKMLYC